MSVDDVCEELMWLGVDSDLVGETGGNEILLRALYIYVLVEAFNA